MNDWRKRVKYVLKKTKKTFSVEINRQSNHCLYNQLWFNVFYYIFDAHMCVQQCLSSIQTIRPNVNRLNVYGKIRQCMRYRNSRNGDTCVAGKESIRSHVSFDSLFTYSLRMCSMATCGTESNGYSAHSTVSVFVSLIPLSSFATCIRGSLRNTSFAQYYVHSALQFIRRGSRIEF